MVDPESKRDELVEREVERALAPYVALLPPDMVEVFREQLREELSHGEVGKRLLRAARPEEARDRSGDRALGDEVAPAPTARAAGDDEG